MKKNLFARLVALLLMMCMVAGMAIAEEAVAIPGNMPERGLVFPFVETDSTELGLSTAYVVAGTEDISELPVAYISYADEEGLQKALTSFSEEDLEDEDMMWEMLITLFSHNYNIFTIALFEQEYYDAQIASGKTVADFIGSEKAVVLGENDGYVYIGVESYDDLLNAMETETQKERAEKAIARCKELVAGLTFQPVVFADGEFTEIPEGALAFSTKDLNGNEVTNQLFLGKKLTVLNVWGTHCTPCISEMPELAEWSQNMPEGVQLVGLVSDLKSYEDAEMLETAQYICDATGANVYTNLVANADFADLLSGVVGVPTTFFIDDKGMFVGDPIVGVNVAGLKSFVESYVAE